MREILYYNQEIDEVDLSLLEEVLGILNSSLNLRASHKQKMLDYFVFSHNSPGLLLSSNFEFHHSI
jgi:hypothetical protein